MTTRQPSTAFLALATAVLLASCGGGGDAPADPSPTGCPVATEQSWLRGYMADAYLWAGRSPNPAPDGYATVAAYFDALKFQGDATTPADRWSFSQTTASFQSFFGDGQTLGYGLFVNGIELTLPLKVRYTEPNSPAGVSGAIQRGDTIVSLNGRSAAELVAANDFNALNASKAGDSLTVVVDRGDGSGPRTVVLTAAVFTLDPVPLGTTVLTAPGGKKVGYLLLKDFISQAEPKLAASLDGIRAAGANELILDLRYNGGGLVSTSQVLSSLIAGTAGNGKVFATIKRNGKPGHPDRSYPFATSAAAAFSRVIVLTGSRTCSASELVVNGLKPLSPATEVVTIGGTTCGKPVGFDPVAQCGNTYSAVNFESVNGAGVGGYYNGLAPTCAIAEDFSGALGSATEKLTAAALNFAAAGACPAGAAAPHDRTAAAALRRRALAGEPGERPGMWAD